MQNNPIFIRILLGLIFSVPLFFTPFTAFGWHFGKTLMLHILVELFVFSTLYYYFFRKNGKLSFNANWLDVAFVLFGVSLFLTSLTGVNFGQSLWMNQSRAMGVFTWIHLLFLYFFLRIWLRSKESWMWAMKWSIGVGFLVTLTAIFQNHLPSEWRGDFGGRLAGILGNPGFFGAYMIPLFGISIFQFFEEKKLKKLMYGCTTLWFATMIIFSASRGAFAGLLGILVVLGVGFLLQYIRSIKATRGKIKYFLAGICVLFLCIGGIMVGKNSSSFSRLFNFSFHQQTGKTRLMAWDIAWKSFLEKPVFGWGYGNYEVPFNKYFNPQFFQYGFSETVWDKPHSAPFEMLSAMGIFSIFYFAFFAVCFFLLGKKIWKESSEEKMRDFVLLATLFGYAITISVMFDTIAALFLIMFLFSYVSFSTETKWKKDFSANQYSGLSKVLIGVVLAYCLVINIHLFQASIALKTSLNKENLFGFSQRIKKVFALGTALEDENAILLAERFSKMEKANVFGKANTMYWKEPALQITEVLEKYVLRYPENLSYPMWAAEVYLILGQFDNPDYYVKAVNALKKAETIAPQKQEVKILLTRAYMLQKDFENALLTVQHAVDIAPNIGHSYYFLALTQEGAGKRSEGLVSFAKSFENGYSPTENERQLYIDILTEEKKYRELAEQYIYLMKQNPEKPDWYVKLAAVYALEGKKKEALEMVEKAVVLYPPLQEEANNFIKANNLR